MNPTTKIGQSTVTDRGASFRTLPANPGLTRGVRLLVTACVATAFANQAGLRAADPVRSPVHGVLRIECRGASDTMVSAPFHPRPRWMGRLKSAATEPVAGRVRLTLSPAPSVTTGAYASPGHFLVLRDLAGSSGLHLRILANTGDTVDVAASLAELSALAVGAKLAVVPAWTLDSLFPPATQTALHQSTGRLLSQRGSEILLMDPVSVGIRLAPAKRFFVTSTGWLNARDFTPAGLETIAPGEAFIIRHPPGSANTVYLPHQQVNGSPFVMKIRTSGSGPQDTALSMPRPVSITLDQLDMGISFVESAGTDASVRKDELLVYDNSATGINKAPARTYFRVAGQWRRDTSGFPTAGQETIEPGAGLVIRKAANPSVQPVTWTNLPTYNLAAP